MNRRIASIFAVFALLPLLISAVSAEVGLPVDKFRITSIKELS